eukprot:Nk52_evm36s1705 gene=Nk52_evmTU36s1705
MSSSVSNSLTVQKAFPEDKVRLGTVRKSFLKNCLLVKDSVGKCKASTHSLPGRGHAYGESSDPTVNGTAEAINAWTAYVPPKDAIPDCDFVTMNRNCVINGIMKPRDVALYRKANEIRFTKKDPRVLMAQKREGLNAEGMPAFGIKSSEPTDMSSLLSHAHQHRWLMQTKASQEQKAVAKKVFKPNLYCRRTVEASTDQGEESSQEKEPFTIKRFKKKAKSRYLDNI